MESGGYKTTRTTIVLAAASGEFQRLQDAGVKRAIEVVQQANFDLARVSSEVLEAIYEGLDDETMDRVREEFSFDPRVPHAIIDYKACIGICELCGKGDSRDDGVNADKLRYAFRLTNTGGGKDVWCGSTCILNHGLKVQGATTAEQARDLLEKTLREYIARWKIEAWRVAHGDHIAIPDHFNAISSRGRSLFRYHLPWSEAAALGLPDFYALSRETSSLVKKMRLSARFYERRGYLTEAKMGAWVETKIKLDWFEWLDTVIEGARDLRGEARLSAFAHAYRERQQMMEAAKKKRVRKARAFE